MASTAGPRGTAVVTVQRPRRYGVYTAMACEGGTVVAGGRFRTPVAPRVAQSLTGEATFTFELPLAHPAVFTLVRGRVVRVWESDAAWDEWTILTTELDTAAARLRVTCGPAATVGLTRIGELGETVGTLAHYEHEWLGLDALAVLSRFVIPWCVARGASWLAVGAVDPTEPLALTFRGTVLAAVSAIADAAEREWQIRRNGTTGYLVDIVTRVGSGNPTALVAARRDLLGVTERQTVLNLATRIIPLGAEQDGVRATMAGAVWEITSVVGLVVTLADPAGGDGPILVDGQLVGARLRNAAGALTLITASSASAQTVTVASAAGLAVGARVTFAADAAGTALDVLEHPEQLAADGVWTPAFSRSDIPAVVNLVPNPAVRVWPGALPTGWTLVGAPTVTKQTAAPFLGTGPQTLKVVAAAANLGVLSPAGPVRPTAARPYGAGFARVWVVSGQVRVELVITTPTGTVVFPSGGATDVATNAESGLWTVPGVSGEDLHALGATAVAVRVVAHGGPATWYVDHVQAANDAHHSPFVEGAGPTQLWQAANRRLAESATLGGLDAFGVRLVDLARWDPERWGTLPTPLLGGLVAVRDPAAAIAVETRIVARTLDYAAFERTELTLSSAAADISRRNGPGARARRVAPRVTEPGEVRQLQVAVEEWARTTTTSTMRVKVVAGRRCPAVTVTPSVPGGVVSPASAVIATVTGDFSTTGHADFVVTRPAGPVWSVTFTAKATAAGFLAGSTTATVQDVEGQRRAWLALNTTGHLNPTTKSGTLFISKGLWATSAAHEELVSFNFASIPRVLPTMIGGNISDPRPGGWSGPGFNPALPVHCEVAAEDVSPLGFRAKAELVQRGSVLGREHAMTPAPLVGVGDLASATLTAAPASGNRYRVYFHPKVTALVHSEAGDEWSFASLVLGVYVNDGTGFTHVASRSYVVNETASSTKDFLEDFVEFVRSGLDSTDQVKLQVDAFHLEPGSAGGSFEVLTPRVEYTTAAGEARKSMTPDGEQNLYHLLISEETS